MYEYINTQFFLFGINALKSLRYFQEAECFVMQLGKS